MIYSKEEMERFQHFYNQGVTIFKRNRENEICERSPYSRHINPFIYSKKELDIFLSLNLKEDYITRPALLLNIQPDYLDENGVSNLSKMLNGKPPIDATTQSVIHLHHIGQDFRSPFAELPQVIHNSHEHYSSLHQCDIVSWRNEPHLLKATKIEFKNYWKLRGEMYL